MNEQKILKIGWGYWDVTRYPYGGCFRRATTNEVVTLIGAGNKVDESKIAFTDGRVAYAPNRGLEAF
jgi:hypothetical protein